MPKVATGILIKNVRNENDLHSDGTCILLCQRLKTEKYPLKWEFPGGKLENGETPEQALIRELFEELDVTVHSFSEYFFSHNSYPDGREFEVFYYLIKEFSGAMKNNVFQDIQWVPVSELQSYDILEGNKSVVDRLIKEYAEA